MSEFDFEELDRAVNSALTGDTPVASFNPAPKAAPSPDPVVSRQSDESQSTDSTPERPTGNPAARRASGRFMDMVHPSSYMRSGDAPSTPAANRAPSSSNNAFTPKPFAETAPNSASAPSTPPQKSSWASDLHMATGPASITRSTSPTKSGTDFASSAITEPSAMESPFLRDTKVEKRPLGVVGSSEESKPAEAPSLAKSIDEALAEVSMVEAEDNDPSEATPDWAANMVAPAASEEKLLEAPEPEVLLEQPEPHDRLEDSAPQGLSAAMQFSQEKTLGDIPNPHVDVEDAAAVEPEVIVSQPVADTHTPVAPVVSTAIPAGPASITQQYTEKPSTSAEPGAIYDTEAYHQPITPKAKKRSGAWVVLWIILLIVAGAGAGAAFYFYVLPML